MKGMICHRKEVAAPRDIIITIVLLFISEVNSRKSPKLIIHVTCSYVHIWCVPVTSGLCVFFFVLYNGIYSQFSAFASEAPLWIHSAIISLFEAFPEVLCFELGKCKVWLFINHYKDIKSPPLKCQLELWKGKM